MATVEPYSCGNSTSAVESKKRQLKSQGSTLQTRLQLAVCVRQAYKSYGSKKNSSPILNGLNMTVTKGAIYGLLGSSGCGKTTLLSCIVGRKKLNSGDVWVLGAKNSGIPGTRLGYMPQEIALYGEFTIRETLLYYGILARMSKDKIKKRTDLLTKLLLLPHENSLVSTLSGGQQRRVSLSAALIHEPDLLILDEPTVGVDPLLRQNIWAYLENITRGGRTTVIITTHYIDEAKQATTIGLMRGGYFLAEESPTTMLTYFGCETLEEVFLKLSVLQENTRRPSVVQETTENTAYGEGDGDFATRGTRYVTNIRDREPKMKPSEGSSWNSSSFYPFLNKNHLKALIWKDCLWFFRNLSVLLFILALPVCQIVLFSLTIGHGPKKLPIAVVNHELGAHENCKSIHQCNSTQLSCMFLSYLTKYESIRLTYYHTNEEAERMVVRGKSLAYLIFPANYSNALRRRVFAGKNAKNEDLIASTIECLRDYSNYPFMYHTVFFISEAFKQYIQDFSLSCGINQKIFMLPIRYNQHVYGKNKPDITNFSAPGLIITTICFTSVSITSILLITERNEGTLDRSLVIGITASEFLFAHAVILFLILVVQTALMLIFAFPICGLTLEGTFLHVILLSLPAGIYGIASGFAIACTCENERTATYAAMGMLLPMMLLCGILWPVEGMYFILRKISVALPLTKPTEGMRAVMAKGWDFSHEPVYLGCVTTLSWSIIMIILSILFLKFKNG